MEFTREEAATEIREKERDELEKMIHLLSGNYLGVGETTLFVKTFLG